MGDAGSVPVGSFSNLTESACILQVGKLHQCLLNSCELSTGLTECWSQSRSRAISSDITGSTVETKGDGKDSGEEGDCTDCNACVLAVV